MKTYVLLIFSNLVNSKIAIIGSGSGGSSVFYYLPPTLQNQVSVFEKSGIVGGRAKGIQICFNESKSDFLTSTSTSTVTSTHQHNNCLTSTHQHNKCVYVEVGATLIADANRNLMQISRDLNISMEASAVTRSMQASAVTPYLATRRSSTNDLGIWNGKEFLVVASTGWWGSVQLFWRYGRDLLKVKTICLGLVNKFLEIYKYLETGLGWSSNSQIMVQLGIKDEFNVTCKAYLEAQGISELYIEEFVGSIVRNMYLTNVDELMAVPCMVGYFGYFTILAFMY